MKRVLLLVSMVSACDAGDETSVRIELGDMWRAALLDGLFDTLELTVTGEGMAPLVRIYTEDTSFELDVPSGGARTFAVEGHNGGDPHETQYWGYTREDLPPGGEVDITIPIAIAGRLPGEVALSDGATVPATVEISLDYFVDPIAELPGPFVTEATNGVFSLPLPLGSGVPYREFEVTVGPVSVAGVSYEMAEPGIGYVDRQGVNYPLQLLLDPVCAVGGTVQCCSDNDCTVGDVCNLGTHVCEAGCVVGGAIECCSSTDCTSPDICNTTTHLCECDPVAVECCDDTACTGPGQVCDTGTRVCVETQVFVEVVDVVGVPYPDGLDVLVHDSTGAYLRQVATDTSGLASAQVASGDMVSVLYAFADAYTFYCVLTVAAVEPGDTIRFELPGWEPYVQQGNLDVTEAAVPPAPVGTSTQSFTVGDAFNYFPAGAAGPYTYPMSSTNIGTDGNVDLLGWATDGQNILGFSTHVDLPPSGAALTLGNWNASPLTLTVQFLNVPGKGYTNLYPRRDGREYYLAQFVDMFSGGDYTLPSGFFDSVDVEVSPESFSSSQQYNTWRFVADTWPSPLTVDFNTAFLAPIQDSPGPSVDNTTNAARPTATWSTAATSADFDLVNLQVTVGDMGGVTWVLIAPSSITVPVTVPDLSSAPTEFHPDYWAGTMTNIAVELYDFDTLTYREFITGVGHALVDGKHLPTQGMVIRKSNNGTIGYGG